MCVPVLDKFVFFYLDCSKKSLKSALRDSGLPESGKARRFQQQENSRTESCCPTTNNHVSAVSIVLR